jgi:hypothetical protein
MLAAMELCEHIFVPLDVSAKWPDPAIKVCLLCHEIRPEEDRAEKHPAERDLVAA